MFLFRAELVSEEQQKIINFNEKITLIKIEESMLNKENLIKE